MEPGNEGRIPLIAAAGEPWEIFTESVDISSGILSRNQKVLHNSFFFLTKMEKCFSLVWWCRERNFTKLSVSC